MARVTGHGQGSDRPRTAGDDVLDEAYAAMAALDPEFGPGLSNHGPMAAEALVRLGRARSVDGFMARYGRRLAPAPPPGRPLLRGGWEGALGVPGRYPDWVATFERELAGHPPSEVVARWVPRLAPGTVAAAGHGLLRTAHAARAAADPGADTSPGSPRSSELARGLAYWAARYQELPGPPVLVGPASVPDAVAGLPSLPDEAPPELLISDRVRHLDMVATPFEQAVAALAPAEGLSSTLDALAAAGARAGLGAQGQGPAVALVHAVTLPLALDLVLPALAESDRPTVFAYTWQATAALHSAFAVPPDPVPTPPATGGPEPLWLVDAALGTGDEHAIKLTEACLRSFARTKDPVLVAAAARYIEDVTPPDPGP